MSLLRDIQMDATSEIIPVSTLLQRCTILAARLGNDDFTRWLLLELDGYSQRSQVPDYRRVKVVRYLGDFVGPGQAQTNYLLRSVIVKEQLQTVSFDRYPLSRGIRFYERLLKENQDGNISLRWPENVIKVVAPLYEPINVGMTLVAARSVISRPRIDDFLYRVRSKILGFTLDIERENPDAGEAPMTTRPVPEAVLQQIFNNTFHAPISNVAVGGQDYSQHSESNS